MSIPLVEPVLGRVSGGLRYNHAVARASGARIWARGVAGAWPQPHPADVERLHRVLDEVDGPVLVDGLIGCSLSRPLHVRSPVVILVHAPLAHLGPEPADRERACLDAASAVVATSHTAAAELRRLHGIEAAVAVPGTEPRRESVGGPEGNGGNLLCIGAVESNKNQVFLARVLSALAESGTSDWHCTLAGPVTDDTYAAELHRVVAGLAEGRISMPGPVEDEALDELYQSADLLLLPSRRETYGLVVAEAAAAGVPAVVTAGTGAEEALVSGGALPLDQSAWQGALRRWLTDPSCRARLRGQARSARPHLRRWQDTAADLTEILQGVP